jgi:hypothetical protein
MANSSIKIEGMETPTWPSRGEINDANFSGSSNYHPENDDFISRTPGLFISYSQRQSQLGSSSFLGDYWLTKKVGEKIGYAIAQYLCSLTSFQKSFI